MTKHVIVITGTDALPTPTLLEALREIGFEALIRSVSAPPAGDGMGSTRTAAERSKALDSSTASGADSLAVLCEVSVPAQTPSMRVALRHAATEWPSVPLIACYSSVNKKSKHEMAPPSAASLKRLGFTAVISEAAQLPGVLHELARRGDFDDLPLSLETEAEAVLPNLLLPGCLSANVLRQAFELVASLHFADSQKSAAQTSLANLAALVHAHQWSIFLATTNNLVDDPSFELLAAHGRSLGASANDSSSGNMSLDITDQPDLAGVPSEVVRHAVKLIETLSRAEHEQQILAVPLVANQKLIGALEVVRSAVRSGETIVLPREFSSDESALLTALAVPLSAALANSVRIAEAERLSQTDDLTKLHNARFLRQFLTSEVKRARRYESSIACLFFDLDNFKLVNDIHGHLVGSHVLMELATGVLAALRDTDMVARYGGDEFVVILPETGMERALMVAERIRSHVAAHRFTGGRRLNLHLTASFGVAAFPEHAQSPQQLIAAADKAMYEAKAAHKNCVHAAN